MWWLYLDESGDLGFDFVNAKPSKFFTICIVATSERRANIAFKRSVRRTLRNKLNRKGLRKRIVEELKGSATSFVVKQYAWNLIADERFGIYSVTLNKKKLFKRLADDKDRVYNYVARLVIDQIPFERAGRAVQLIIDRSKGKKQAWHFNEYIQRQLQGRIDPNMYLDFIHADSKTRPGLQWADLFAWGIFQKYERKNCKWFDVFKEKVLYETQFLK